MALLIHTFPLWAAEGLAAGAVVSPEAEPVRVRRVKGRFFIACAVKTARNIRYGNS